MNEKPLFRIVRCRDGGHLPGLFLGHVRAKSAAQALCRFIADHDIDDVDELIAEGAGAPMGWIGTPLDHPPNLRKHAYHEPVPVPETERARPVNINDCFESKFLRASDLPDDRDVIVEVASVSVEDVGTDDKPERKPVMHFARHKRGLPINKTNSATLQALLGTPETSEWTGQRIALFKTQSPFRGELVDAIRIRAAPTSDGAAAPAHYGTGDPHVAHASRVPAPSAPHPAPVDAPAAAVRDF